MATTFAGARFRKSIPKDIASRGHGQRPNVGAIARMLVGASCGIVRPTPRLSKAMTRKRDARSPMIGCQLCESDASPAIRNSGAPLPWHSY